MVCGRAINGCSTDGPGDNLLSVELTDSYRVRRRQMQMNQTCVRVAAGLSRIYFCLTLFLSFVIKILV